MMFCGQRHTRSDAALSVTVKTIQPARQLSRKFGRAETRSQPEVGGAMGRDRAKGQCPDRSGLHTCLRRPKPGRNSAPGEADGHAIRSAGPQTS